VQVEVEEQEKIGGGQADYREAEFERRLFLPPHYTQVWFNKALKDFRLKVINLTGSREMAISWRDINCSKSDPCCANSGCAFKSLFGGPVAL
jgi:hypothetical protein